MEFRYRYFGNSGIENTSAATDIRFEPDTSRDPTFFVGNLKQQLPFREAISVLHDVVIADLRTRPKDRQVYFEWLEAHQTALLAEFKTRKSGTEDRIKAVNAEINSIYKAKQKLMGPFYNAQQAYFNYLLKTDYDAWWVLDPVITVHPDELFFECFSADESTYGRLSCGYEVFENIETSAFGTTNIDYSDDLYKEFQKIRSYKNTQFKIDPGGFDVKTSNEDQYIEEKIDLPDSWVRGFLQVSSAMSMPMACIDFHPLDIHNICYVLKRNKEKIGPRSLRFQLKPGKPVKLIFEPWNLQLHCPRSTYFGDEEQEIKIWGRRRLLTLERLIPIARSFKVYLLGTGMPSFFVADLGDMSFTLGLSGWTANDWSRMGNFDLMAPRAEVDEVSKARVFKALQETYFATEQSLGKRLQLDKALVSSSLGMYAQAGRVVFDLAKGVYRIRELSQEPLPMSKLRYQNEREEKAETFVKANLVAIGGQSMQDQALQITGTVRDDAKRYNPQITIDADQRMVGARCDCYFYGHNKMFKGPCEHMLALRRRHAMEKND